jgi:hypothetical protein
MICYDCSHNYPESAPQSRPLQIRTSFELVIASELGLVYSIVFLNLLIHTFMAEDVSESIPSHCWNDDV